MKHTLLILLLTMPCWATTYHMSTTGNDTDGSSEANGFTTPQGVVAYITANATWTDGHTITIHGGTYTVEPLVLTSTESGANGSPVIWIADTGETVNWYVSDQLSGSDFTGGGGLDTVVVNPDDNLRVITVNGEWVHLARDPDWDTADDRNIFHFADTGTPDSKTQTKYKSGAFNPTGWSGGWLTMFSGENFKANIESISSFDTGTRLITHSSVGSAENIDPNDRYWLSNIQQLCDAPNEWYYNSGTTTLYLYPPASADPLDAGDVIQIAQGVMNDDADIVEMTGTDWHEFHDLNLGVANGDAFELLSCDNIIIDSCTMKNLFRCGVHLDDSTNVDVNNCTIEWTGEEGYNLDDGGTVPTTKDKLLTANNCTITRCTFNRNNIFFSGLYGALTIRDCVGVTAEYNTITNCPRIAIDWAGNDHVIRYNRISNTMRWTEDAGPIYNRGRRQEARGTDISYNWIDANDCEMSGSSHDEGYGIYLDDAAAGVTVTHNVILYSENAGIFLHGGRDNIIKHNIIVECEKDSQVKFGSVKPGKSAMASMWTDLDDLENSVGAWVYGTFTTAYPAITTVVALENAYDPISDMSERELFNYNTFQRNIIIYPNINTYYMTTSDANVVGNNDWDDNYLFPGSSDNRQVRHEEDVLLGTITDSWATWQGRGFDTDSNVINTDDFINPERVNDYVLIFNFDTDPNVIDLDSFADGDPNLASWRDVNGTEVTSLTLGAYEAIVLFQVDPPSSDLTDAARYFTVTIPAAQVGTGGVTDYTVLLTRGNIPDAVVDSNTPSTSAQENGGDLRFTSDADVYSATQYAGKVYSWGYDGNDIEVYFGPVTLSDSADNVFRVWYDTDGATTQPAVDSAYGAESVWHSSVKAVYLFDEDPDGAAPELTDHTSNDNDGTTFGTMTSGDEIAGQVNNCWDLEGTDDYVDCGSDVSVEGAIFTVSFWVNANTSSSDQPIVAWDQPSSAANYPAITVFNSDSRTIWYGDGSNWVYYDPNFPDDTWTHVVLIQPSNDQVTDSTMYFDGEPVDQNQVNEGIHVAFTDLILGANPNTDHMDGQIDQFMLFNAAKNAAWVKTHYNNINDRDAFATEGAVTEAASGSSDTGVQVIIIIITASLPLVIFMRRKGSDE